MKFRWIFQELPYRRDKYGSLSFARLPYQPHWKCCPASAAWLLLGLGRASRGSFCGRAPYDVHDRKILTSMGTELGMRSHAPSRPSVFWESSRESYNVDVGRATGDVS